jgi:hypothetical protein
MVNVTARVPFNIHKKNNNPPPISHHPPVDHSSLAAPANTNANATTTAHSHSHRPYDESPIRPTRSRLSLDSSGSSFVTPDHTDRPPILNVKLVKPGDAFGAGTEDRRGRKLERVGGAGGGGGEPREDYLPDRDATGGDEALSNLALASTSTNVRKLFYRLLTILIILS